MKNMSRGVIRVLAGLVAGITVLVFVGCGNDSDKAHSSVGDPAGHIKPVVELTVEDSEASESGEEAVFRFTLDQMATSDLVVYYYLDPDSTATSGSDFAELQGMVTIPSGSDTAEITVTPIDDNEIDVMETVIISLSNGHDYNIGANRMAQAKIAGNDAPQLTVATDTPLVTENWGVGLFTITLSEMAAENMTVAYQITNDSSATLDIDYEALSGTATVVAGEQSVSIPVNFKDDDLFEPDEKVIIELLPSGSDYELGFPQTADMTVTSDELPTVDIVTALDTATENGTEAIFMITIPAPLGQDLVIDFQVSGTAAEGTDYRSLPRGLVIPAGETSAEIIITPLADSEDEEGDEFVNMELVAGEDYSLGNFTEATVTINDYVIPMKVEVDPLPMVTWEATDNTADKDGDTGTFRFSIDRTLSQDLNISIIPFEYAGTSAIPGIDYIHPPYWVTIPEGESSANVTITPIADSAFSGQRHVFLVPYSGSTYNTDALRVELGELNTRLVTILERSDLPRVRVFSMDPSASETGDTASFTVEIDPPQPTPTRVCYKMGSWDSHNYMGMAAVWGEDVELLPGSITIPAGSRSVTQEVIVLKDNVGENQETLFIALSSSSQYACAHAESFVELEIFADKSFNDFTVEALDPIASERGLDPAVFVVRLAQPAARDVYISIEHALGGNAVPNSDYETYPSGTLVIPQGGHSAELMIVPIDDDESEQPEQIAFLPYLGPEYRMRDWNYRLPAPRITIHSDEIFEVTPPSYERPLVSASIVNLVASESDGTPGVLRFTLTEAQEEDVIIVLSVHGDAVAGEDYQRLEESYTIPAGETSIDIEVRPIDDDFLEPLEKVDIVYQLAQSEEADVYSSVGSIWIRSDEKGPHASIVATNAIARENGEVAVCEIHLDQEASSNIYVQIGTGWGADESDYLLEGITSIDYGYYHRDAVMIPAGRQSAEFRIRAVDDESIEGVEKVVFNLGKGEGYLLDDEKEADVYLLSDDSGPLARIVPVRSMASPATADAVFEIALDQPATTELSIKYGVRDWAHLDGPAVYEELPGSATIPKGATSVWVEVEATDEASASGETLEITLVPGPGYGITRENLVEIFLKGESRLE